MLLLSSGSEHFVAAAAADATIGIEIVAHEERLLLLLLLLLLLRITLSILVHQSTAAEAMVVARVSAFNHGHPHSLVSAFSTHRTTSHTAPFVSSLLTHMCSLYVRHLDREATTQRRQQHSHLLPN